MFARQTVAAILAAFVLVAAVGPAAAAGGDTNSSVTATVQVTDEATIIAYEVDGDPAANTDVTVDAVGEASFEGAGSYSTNENGTVELPTPDKRTTLALGVKSGNVDAVATVELQPPETDTWETTVSFEADAASDDGSAHAASSADGADADDSAQADGSADIEGDVSFVQQLLVLFIPGYDAAVEADAQGASGDDGGSETPASSEGDAQSDDEDAVEGSGDNAAQAEADIGNEIDADVHARTDEAAGSDDETDSADGSADASATSTASPSSDDDSTGASGSAVGNVTGDVDIGVNGTSTITTSAD